MIFVYTPEERATLEAIDREALNAMAALKETEDDYGADSQQFKDAKKDYLQGEAKRQQTFSSLLADMEEARFNKLGTPAAILADAKQQAEDIIVYLYARAEKNAIKKAQEQGKQRTIINMAAGGFYRHPLGWDYEDLFIAQKKKVIKDRKQLPLLFDTAGMIAFITRDIVNVHIAALQGTPEAAKLTAVIAEAVEASPYTAAIHISPKDTLTADSAIFRVNTPMFYTSATDALARLSNRDIEKPAGAKNAKIEATTSSGEFKIVISGADKLAGTLGVNTHKLLCAGLTEFTRINGYGEGRANPVVNIPFCEYARLLGYEIDERETDTPEAAAKEKKRAAEARKKARKRIKQDVDLLSAMRWTWRGNASTDAVNFESVAILDRGAILDGYSYIVLEFGRNFSEKVKKGGLITQYHQGLYMIDARNPNAYIMGMQMTKHFNMYSNQTRGTADRLKVSTLLSYTRLPTMEDLRNESHDNSRHWEIRIKDPFENSLNELTGKIISGWKYTRAKGKALTKEEQASISDYVVFSDLYVQFDIIEPVDHSKRIEERAKKKAQAAEKKAKGRPKKK